MSSPIKANTLPSKTVLSATYSLIDNGPDPKLDPSIDPDEPIPDKDRPYLRVGVVHSFRTLYQNTDIVGGPFEQVMTVGPGETVEVIIEAVRRKTIEEENESRLESTQEETLENRSEEELTDKISSVIQRTENTSSSVNVSGSVGVFSGGIEASANYSTIKTDSSEHAARRLKEASKRVSLQFSKSFMIKSRRIEDTTTRDFSRRLIQNSSDVERHFGLRKAMQQYSVATQYLAPKLALEILISEPGRFLGIPRIFTENYVVGPFLQRALREMRWYGLNAYQRTFGYQNQAGALYLPIPQQVPFIRAQFIDGGILQSTTLTGSTAAGIWEVRIMFSIFGFEQSPDNPNETRLRIDYSKTYLEGTLPPVVWVTIPEVAMLGLDSKSQITWDKNGPELTDFLQKYKGLITAQSKVQARPNGDLRREERDEMLRRALLPLSGSNGSNAPSLANILDMESSFYQIYPPYYRRTGSADIAEGNAEAQLEYDIPEDIAPAKLGTSLGWRLQLDGDGRRNEFLNSPVAKVCIPFITHDKEQITKIATALGRQLSDATLVILDEISARAERVKISKSFFKDADDVPFDKITDSHDETTIAPDQLYLALFPVIDMFQLNEPLAGFLYEPLNFGK